MYLEPIFFLFSPSDTPITRCTSKCCVWSWSFLLLSPTIHQQQLANHVQPTLTTSTRPKTFTDVHLLFTSLCTCFFDLSIDLSTVGFKTKAHIVQCAPSRSTWLYYLSPVVGRALDCTYILFKHPHSTISSNALNVKCIGFPARPYADRYTSLVIGAYRLFPHSTFLQVHSIRHLPLPLVCYALLNHSSSLFSSILFFFPPTISALPSSFGVPPFSRSSFSCKSPSVSFFSLSWKHLISLLVSFLPSPTQCFGIVSVSMDPAAAPSMDGVSQLIPLSLSLSFIYLFIYFFFSVCYTL